MSKFKTNAEPSLPHGVDEEITDPPTISPTCSSDEEDERIVDEENSHSTIIDKEADESVTRDQHDHKHIEILDCTSPTSDISVFSERSTKKDPPQGSIADAVAAAVSAALSATEKANAANESANVSIASLRQKKLNVLQSLQNAEGINNSINITPTQPIRKKPDPIETITEDSFRDEYYSTWQLYNPQVHKSFIQPHSALPTSAYDDNSFSIQRHHSPQVHKDFTQPPPTPATPVTVTSSPPDSPNSNSPATVVIEHRNKGEKKSYMAFFMKHRKKIIFMVVFWAFIFTGSSAYMLPDFLSIPGLNTQIKELTEQVDRLEYQIDELNIQNGRLETNIDLLTDQVDELEEQVTRLEDEVGRLGGEVDRLQGNVDTLDEIVSTLETTNAELSGTVMNLEVENDIFKGLNLDLNLTNTEYEQLNLQLKSSNTLYEENNAELNFTVSLLSNEVDKLKVTEQNLTITVDEYQLRNQELSVEVDSLSSIRLDLDGRVQDLGQQVTVLQDENANYAKLNRDLSTIVTFLNETDLEFRDTYASLASALAAEITARQSLLVQDTHLKYSALVLHWNCDLDSTFRLRDFVKDETLPIGSDYEGVISYLEEELLGEVCINTQDLESFFLSNILQPNEQLESISLVELKSGVSEYTTKVFDYYFPDEGEQGGLSENDWREANYACENLPADKLFSSSNT
uniref:Uncharacterized protein n=1 Tax=Ditylum brightwellii TaxID=49249 RepID=A0A7S2EIC3_9STRA|mmetsp:Transcript_31314/g.46735  ORF Transcript_31314/g.46735 Transcript_31314/m.46735 type:complete len:687 (+) Transcript_31314:97-2157(+)